MQIIDIEKKGNVVRFYLGENGKQWGDDWDDAPYEHNAERVYGEYIKATKDVAFPFDYLVFEPCDGVSNSGYSKQDMIKRKVPCVVVVPYELYKEDYFLSDTFDRWVAVDGVIKYYFGDEMEP